MTGENPSSVIRALEPFIYLFFLMPAQIEMCLMSPMVS